MEKELNIIQMEILNMKVIILMMKEKEIENIFGKMVLILLDNRKMVYFMVKEQCIIQMEK